MVKDRPASARRDILKAWWQASRPPFFIATLGPLGLGFTATVKYTGLVRPALFALVLGASFLVHLAANLADDLFDHLQGVDAGAGIGGSRVIQEGKISPRALGLALVILYGLALAAAFVIIGFSGRPWLMWGLIVFAALSSFFYVAPPVKYGHRGLGEVMVFLNMGLIMTVGTFLALAEGRWDSRVPALALPVAFMVANILYFQSLPEMELDRAAGKLTLAGRLGPKRAVTVQALWWPLVWLLLAGLWLAGLAAWPALLGLLTLPLHLRAQKALRAAAASDWISLDGQGHLIRKLYLLNSLALIAAVALN
ncbi:MAG: prenyltransferase [Candidatus Adiutrix sp.]|jgi:1,4-dihydroxy-2-naphthoate octaprenyltransferase|nr:prenyltransferase [Candidatus Adiutrix sp.]